MTSSTRRCATSWTRCPARTRSRRRVGRRDRRRHGGRPRDHGRARIEGALGRGRRRRSARPRRSGRASLRSPRPTRRRTATLSARSAVATQLEERYRDQKLQAALERRGRDPAADRRGGLRRRVPRSARSSSAATPRSESTPRPPRSSPSPAPAPPPSSSRRTWAQPTTIPRVRHVRTLVDGRSRGLRARTRGGAVAPNSRTITPCPSRIPRSQSRKRRRSCGRPGAFRPEPPTRSRSPSSGPARSRATGRGADRPGRACASASSTAASSQGHPLVGRDPAVRRRLGRPGRRGGRRGRHARATSAATGPRARGSCGRSRRTARSSASACSGPASPGSGGVLLAGLRWAVEQGFDVDEHEPLDDEAPVRRDPPRARPTRRTSGAPCSSRRRTTCRSRATRGGSPRSSPSGATRSPIRSPSTTTPTRRWSSSPAASTSRWPGPAARRIRCTGNSFATPHMPASARSSSASIRS